MSSLNKRESAFDEDNLYDQTNEVTHEWRCWPVRTTWHSMVICRLKGVEGIKIWDSATTNLSAIVCRGFTISRGLGHRKVVNGVAQEPQCGPLPLCCCVRCGCVDQLCGDSSSHNYLRPVVVMSFWVWRCPKLWHDVSPMSKDSRQWRSHVAAAAWFCCCLVILRRLRWQRALKDWRIQSEKGPITICDEEVGMVAHAFLDCQA